MDPLAFLPSLMHGWLLLILRAARGGEPCRSAAAEMVAPGAQCHTGAAPAADATPWATTCLLHCLCRQRFTSHMRLHSSTQPCLLPGGCMLILCTAGSFACRTEDFASGWCHDAPPAAGLLLTPVLPCTLMLACAGTQPLLPATVPASLSNARTEDKHTSEGVNGGQLHCTALWLLSAERREASAAAL